MKSVNQADLIKILKEDIIHRFSLPQSNTANQGTIFIGDIVQEFANKYKFKLMHSTSYFTKANGQAKSSNKVIKGILEKII